MEDQIQPEGIKLSTTNLKLASENLFDAINNPGNLKAWIDLNREKSFNLAIQELQKISHVELREWFVLLFNKIIEGDNKLIIEDLSSIEMISAQSEYVNILAGGVIVRPVILFKDRKQYFEFMKKIFGGTDDSSAMILKFESDDPNHFLSLGGLIFASRLNGEEIRHEILHTIDPYINKRNKRNMFFDEVIAFYKQYVGNWEGYRKRLSHYYDRYNAIKGGGLKTEEQYLADIDKVLERTKYLVNRYGEVRTHEIMIQCETFGQFLRKI